MKNRIKYLYLFSLLLLGISCIDDTGNYEYVNGEEFFPVGISGLPDKYTVLRSEVLHFTPEVEIGDDPGRYTYSWHITEEVASGIRPTRQHLADTKDLNYQVLLNAGDWRLSFLVTDKEKDLYSRHEIKLTITASSIGAGWYVLKDINDQTDFDYINKEGEMYADVLAPTGSRLAGKAVSMVYQPGQYYQLFPAEDGSSTLVGGLKVFHILSTKDIRVFDSKTLSLFKTFEEMFYEVPEKCEPQFLDFNSPALFLVNAGRVYSIFTSTSHYGIFGTFTVGDYYFFNRMVLAKSSNALVFDTKSNSFCSVMLTVSTVDAIYDKPSESEIKGPTSVTNMPYSLVKMESGESTAAGFSAFALMKHSITGEYYLAQMLYQGTTAYPIVDFNLVPSEFLLPDADLIAAPTSGSFIYFAKDNKIYSYVGASAETEKQRLLLEFAPNEKVTHIKQFSNTATGGYNYLAILTNVDSKWKLRIYTPKGVGELEPEVVMEYEGEGNGRYIMYRNN